MDTGDDRSAHSFWLVHAGVWTGIAVIWIAASAAYNPPTLFWLQTTVIAGLGCAMSAPLRRLYRPLAYRQPGAVPLVLAVVAASTVTGIAWTVVHNTVPILLFRAAGVEVREIGGIARILRGTFLDVGVILIWSFGYVVLLQDRIVREEREVALRAELARRDALLAALRYQLNPHFLFNALNAASTLILQSDARVANELIGALAAFLRGILSGDDHGLVPLAREIEITHQYLAIERIRFGDRLQVTTEFDDNALGASVPVLLLQPLVENAVRHAVSHATGEATVRMTGMCVGHRLRLTVENPSSPDHQGAGAGLGIGLRNTRDRLTTLYGNDHQFTLRNHDDHGKAMTTVTIDVPDGRSDR